MCGITGFNWEDRDLAVKLNDLLVHRGPDRSGVFTDGFVSMAHRRLSILDLSEKGTQPMSNEDGSVRVVFNGEIFNYRELKEDLSGKGHVFNSETDTEVLVHLYEEAGADMVRLLNGQFSFCIYDSKEQKMFLARDRFGILPLYYYFSDGKFIFSSELKGIMGSGIKKEIDNDALALYFRFRYIASPYCILKNVRKLEPGHFMVFDLSEKKIESCKKYWKSKYSRSDDSKQVSAEKILAGLTASVKKRLMADVPVGAFLSGGIDSSAVVSIMKKYRTSLKTFSIKFDYPKFDESCFAKKVSEFFGTDHYEIRFSHRDVRDIIPELVKYFDEPFGDPSMVPMYLVAKIAREHVTVCLSGDGADELLGGYDTYRYFLVLRFLNSMPGAFKGLLRFFFNMLLRVWPRFEIKKMRDLLKMNKCGDPELFERLSEKINRDVLEKLLKRKIVFNNISGDIGEEHGLNAALDFDVVKYLEGDILAKVDRAAMATSLETRPPFLDHSLAEECFNIREDLKIKGRKGKWILKYAFKGILPGMVIRRKKHGFGVPIKHYLKKELYDLVEKYVLNYDKHDMFDQKVLRDMKTKFDEKDTTRIYWNVMMFNMWHERWIVE